MPTVSASLKLTPSSWRCGFIFVLVPHTKVWHIITYCNFLIRISCLCGRSRREQHLESTLSWQYYLDYHELMSKVLLGVLKLLLTCACAQIFFFRLAYAVQNISCPQSCIVYLHDQCLRQIDKNYNCRIPTFVHKTKNNGSVISSVIGSIGSILSTTIELAVRCR